MGNQVVGVIFYPLRHSKHARQQPGIAAVPCPAPPAVPSSSKLDPMSRLFGTDGVRGLANGLLTAELSLQLAQAAAVVLGHDRNTSETRPRAVVARDPRASGEFLAAAVEAGLARSGIDVYDAGVLPTPAAAYLVADLDADFGVMISASHNPAPDNGIKFFARGGQKLPDEVEDAIEEHLTMDVLMPIGGDVGRIRRFADAEDRYVVHLLGTLPN